MSRPGGSDPDAGRASVDAETATDIAVDELRPGDFAVRVGGRTLTAIVPAGVGVPGVAEDDLVLEVVRLLVERGTVVPDPLDVSALLLGQPGLLDELGRRLGV
jgi:hypothetical protein